MAKFSTMYRTANHKTKDTVSTAKDATQSTYAMAKDAAQSTYATAKDAAQSTYATAKDAAQSTYGNVQDKLHTGSDKAVATLLTVLSLADTFLKYRQRQAEKLGKMTQRPLSNFQDALQDRINTGFSKASDAWTNGTEATQSQLKKGTKKAQKNLHKAQKSFSATLDKTSDELNKNAKRARKNLHKTADTIDDMKTSAQHQTTKTLFRIGIVTGIVIALLYTPIAGSEVRRRIAARWEEYRSFFGF